MLPDPFAKADSIIGIIAGIISVCGVLIGLFMRWCAGRKLREENAQLKAELAKARMCERDREPLPGMCEKLPR